MSIAIRDTTRIIGECKNLKVSQEAKKILGSCRTIKDFEKARKANPGKIVKEHYYPVKEFLDEWRKKKDNNKNFTSADAERWFNDATIAYITKKEDDKLTEKYGNKRKRPLNAYGKAGIKLSNVKLVS